SASGPSVATSNYSSGSSANFVSGACTLPAAMPTTTGTYSYTVIISPGQRTVNLPNSITVARPSADPVITCVTAQGQYVPENTDLNCNCSASDLGNPKGRLRVYRGDSEHISGSYGEARVAFSEASVSRDDDGAVFRCVVEWATTDSPRETSFTLHVAYGPSIANLAQPAVFDLHPTSPGSLTLTCNAAEVQPSVRYSWTGRRCVGVTQSTCSFTPTTNDDDDIISCTAINTVTSVSKTSVTRTLRINYPPSNAPEITGYTEGEIVFAGQNKSMTCTVSGGNPAVSAVTFTCDSQGQEVSGASSTLSITASRDYNGRRCSCSARWKNKDTSWYPFTAGVNITVYYPPDEPTIGHKDQRYPFLAGESPRLYCSLPAGPGSGNPPASLTFVGHRGGPGQGEVDVNLGPLDETDNGRKMTCEANNAFTDHINRPRTQDHVLQVYYLTGPTLTVLPNDTCDMTSANTCVVREGGRVHVNCTARSNPPIYSIAWQQSSNNVLDLVANRTLPLLYACNVTTETVGTDDRLPLNDTTVLQILPTYAAEIYEFTANRQHQNLTINENSSMTLNCTALGRPTPGIYISKDGKPIQRVPKGELVTEIQTSILTYESSQATCDVTGDYVCGVDNDHGGQSSNHLRVLVNCGPRLQKPVQPNPPMLNYKGRPVQLSVNIVAFPLPAYFAFVYHGPKNHGPGNNLSVTAELGMHCRNMFDAYIATCNITVNAITSRDAGFYSVRIGNSVGSSTITFEVEYFGE
ncbi:nephrin-like, partial [Littorina saxatilis]|uniref:nephrin-like n=1 Tax=Littorina saxatilis TaxID=31220 RepID=UPI0038B51F81